MMKLQIIATRQSDHLRHVVDFCSTKDPNLTIEVAQADTAIVADVDIIVRFTPPDPPPIAREKYQAYVRVLSFGGKPIVILDNGSRATTDLIDLQRYGVIGGVLAETLVWPKKPIRIGLLANGEEDTKGTSLLQDAHDWFLTLDGHEYVGFLEPVQIHQGVADVVVCDSFTGSVVSQTLTAAPDYLLDIIEQKLNKSVFQRLGRWLAAPTLAKLRQSETPQDNLGLGITMNRLDFAMPFVDKSNYLLHAIEYVVRARKERLIEKVSARLHSMALDV